MCDPISHCRAYAKIITGQEQSFLSGAFCSKISRSFMLYAPLFPAAHFPLWVKLRVRWGAQQR